jgi:hypothetical protein
VGRDVGVDSAVLARFGDTLGLAVKNLAIPSPGDPIKLPLKGERALARPFVRDGGNAHRGNAAAFSYIYNTDIME